MTENSDDRPNANYFSEAVRWEVDVIRSVKRSRLIAWIVAGICAFLAALAMLCLVFLLPLKSFEPYVIEVDKTTGFMEIRQPLAEGELTQNEAITRMYVARFLRAREGYDSNTVKADFELAHLLSSGAAQKSLSELYAPSNPMNPVTQFGWDSQVVVDIKSIQMPNPNEATIRFSTQRIGQSSSPQEHWVSLMRFRYTDAPMKNSLRFENPLGFQVTDYRRDQETVSAGQ